MGSEGGCGGTNSLPSLVHVYLYHSKTTNIIKQHFYYKDDGWRELVSHLLWLRVACGFTPDSSVVIRKRNNRTGWLGNYCWKLLHYDKNKQYFNNDTATRFWSEYYKCTFWGDSEDCGPRGQGQQQKKLQAPSQPHPPLLVLGDTRAPDNLLTGISYCHLKTLRHRWPGKERRSIRKKRLCVQHQYN